MKKVINYFGVLLLGLFLIPTMTFAFNIDDVKSKKELVVKSIKPTDENSFMIISDSFSQKNGGYYLSDCSDDFSLCNISYQGEEVATGIKITYKYDPVVKTVVDAIIKKIPAEGKEFVLNDIEAVSYAKYVQAFWMLTEQPDDLPESEYPNPIRFSEEYRKFIGYNNFIFEPRMGYESAYSEGMGGTATFEYEDTIYGTADGISTKVNYVIYVNDDTTDPLKEIQTRLSKYFPGVKVTYDDSSSVVDQLKNEVERDKQEFIACKNLKDTLDAVPENERDYMSNPGFRQNDEQYNNMCSKYGTWRDTSLVFGDPDEHAKEYEEILKEEEYSFVDNALPGIYTITFKDGGEVYFPAVKDSSKVFNGSTNIITVDSSSSVEVSTKGLIPLDTLIKVARLTSGEEYEAILKVLNKTDVEMFDLKLFSKSADKYITKLDDGSFEVKLPIKDEFMGKDLVVYFVDENDKVEEYEVEVKDGFAVFNTSHFSIYTLAIADKKEETVAIAEEEPVAVINNPATSDNIELYFGMLIISIIGAGSVLARKIKN